MSEPYLMVKNSPRLRAAFWYRVASFGCSVLEICVLKRTVHKWKFYGPLYADLWRWVAWTWKCLRKASVMTKNVPHALSRWVPSVWVRFSFFPGICDHSRFKRFLYINTPVLPRTSEVDGVTLLKQGRAVCVVLGLGSPCAGELPFLSAETVATWYMHLASCCVGDMTRVWQSRLSLSPCTSNPLPELRGHGYMERGSWGSLPKICSATAPSLGLSVLLNCLGRWWVPGHVAPPGHHLPASWGPWGKSEPYLLCNLGIFDFVIKRLTVQECSSCN